MEAVAKQPHEARVQRFAYAALAVLTALAAWDASASNGKIFEIVVPLYARFGLIIAGAVVGVFAAAKRSAPIATAAAGLLVLAIIPAGSLTPGLAGYARGFTFGALVLAFLELVHMTQRYDRAHKLVEEEGASEESLDRVTDEALKTLGARAASALGIALAAVVIALGLAEFGSASWRESIEAASPLGVAVVAIGILGALSLFVLAAERSSAGSTACSSEVAADVPE